MDVNDQIIHIVTIYDAIQLGKVDQTDEFIKCGPYTRVKVIIGPKARNEYTLFGSYEQGRGEESAYQYAKQLKGLIDTIPNCNYQIVWSTQIIR